MVVHKLKLFVNLRERLFCQLEVLICVIFGRLI